MSYLDSGLHTHRSGKNDQPFSDDLSRWTFGECRMKHTERTGEASTFQHVLVLALLDCQQS